MAVIGPPTKPANQPSRADNNQPSNPPAEPTTTEPSRRPTSRAGQPIHPLNFTQQQASNQPTSNLRQLPTSSFSSRLPAAICNAQRCKTSLTAGVHGFLQTLRSARGAFCSLRSAGSAFRVLLRSALLCLCTEALHAGDITRPFALLGGCFLMIHWP